MPTALPAMNLVERVSKVRLPHLRIFYLPAISIAIFTAAAWRTHPSKETIEPAAIVFLRPKRSAKIMLMMVPNIAPPWKVETMAPVVVLFGLWK